MTLPRRPVCAVAVVAFSALGAMHSAGASAAPAPADGTVTRVLAVSDDAYVDAAAPHRTTGGSAKLISSDTAKSTKTSYLKFQLPAAPAGKVLAGARLVAEAESGSASAQLRPVASNAWSEKTLAYASRPPVGAVHAVSSVSATKAATFDVTKLVKAGETRSFALTVDAGWTTFSAKESTPGGPRLSLTYKPVAGKPVPAASVTKFGMSVAPVPGESAAGAVHRLNTQFGTLPVARVFSSGVLPASWNEDATLAALSSGSSVVYSFKGDMKAAAAGAYDARIKSFLGSRPAGRKVWVALNHEPEDDIERGRFTSAQFRAATAHVAPVVRAAGGIPTTILMQYTLTQGSHRDWHDYYSPAIDVLAWDGYNSAADEKVPGYKPAANFVAPVLAVAKETGKAFGWAELGSPCISTDRGCTGRAAWLTSLTQQFSAANAQFATYWNRPDFGGGFDYSLTDAPSVAAWKAGMHR